MIDDPWFYAAAIPAMIILGLSKGGFGVIGILTVPVLSIVVSPVQAAGITLPILILSDMVALASYWRSWDRDVLAAVLPGAMIGILAGWATAAWVSEDAIRLIVGTISVAFAADYGIRHRGNRKAQAGNAAKGAFWGALSGFTSFVSHAGGPPYQVYTAPLRLAPHTFAATSIIFFAIVNAVKTVPYFFLGQFHVENLATSAVLLPVSIPATFLGVWLVRRIGSHVFYEIIYAIIFIVGVYLVIDGLGLLNR